MTDDPQFHVVADADQLARALAVRAICFIGEQGLPSRIVNDGNDFVATHFLATIKDEPVASARIRWFGDCALIERSCFLKAHRNLRLVKGATQFILDHAARKGFRRVVTMAAPEYANLWTRIFGFRRVGSDDVLMPWGEALSLLEREIEPVADAVSLESGAAALMRLESA